MLKECFLFPSLISTEHSIPLLEISHRLSWEPAPWASGAWPPHHPHLGGLLAAQLGSFDICGFLRSISSTVSCSWFLGLTLWFLGLTLWRRGWRWSLGAQGPIWVTALCSGPTQPFSLAGWQLYSAALVLEEPGMGHRQGRACSGLGEGWGSASRRGHRGLSCPQGWFHLWLAENSPPW